MSVPEAPLIQPAHERTTETRLLSYEDAGAILGTTEHHIRRLVREGRLRVVVLGHKVRRVRADDLQRLITENTRTLEGAR